MTCSTFVWISAAAVKECERLGFTVQKGRGEDRFFISNNVDSPFNPSAEIHRIPEYAVEEVTIRATVKSQIPLGLYAVDAKTEMRVAAVMEDERRHQGFFVDIRKVPSKTSQRVDIRAQILPHALHVFRLAMREIIKPNPVYTDEVMSKLD